jgi:hypothetical protein
VIHSYYNHTGQLYGKTVWKTINTIPVTKNKSYNFCFRLLTAWGPYQVDHANMNAGDPNLRVDVLINNQLVLHNARVGSLNVVNNFVPGSSVGDGFNNTNWQQFNVAWNSNASTTATLEIRFVDMALIPIGFGVKPDYPIVSNFTFGLDDIVFKECSTTPAALPRVKVPGTGSIKSNEIFLLTNGEFTEDKTPITSRIITGNVSGLQKPAEIKISQAETNDVGTALTDAYGNFAIRVNGDTAHKIYINGVEYGKIKVQSDGNLQAFQSGGKCTKLITQCSQTATSGDCGDCDDAHRLICGFKEVVIECPPTTTTSTVTTKSQLSASCPTGYTMVQGKCIPDVIVNAPWLDLKTGQIKFFEYKEDMVVDNPAICKYLGVKEFVIKKGKYEIDRSNVNEGASCRLPVVVTVKLPTGKPPVLMQIFEGTNPKGMDCKTYGNSCFWATESNNMEKVQYSIIPIIKNGEIVGIQLVYPPDANGKGNGPPKAAGF